MAMLHRRWLRGWRFQVGREERRCLIETSCGGSVFLTVRRVRPAQVLQHLGRLLCLGVAMEIGDKLTESELVEMCSEIFPDFELEMSTLNGCPREPDGRFDLVELAAWLFENLPRRR